MLNVENCLKPSLIPRKGKPSSHHDIQSTCSQETLARNYTKSLHNTSRRARKVWFLKPKNPCTMITKNLGSKSNEITSLRQVTNWILLFLVLLGKRFVLVVYVVSESLL